MILKKKMIYALSLVVMMTFVVAGCGAQSSSSESKAIKLGFAGPLTGASAQDGESMKKGAALAADVVNKAGGIDGKQIEFVFEDDKSDPKEAASVANKFASDTNILAVVGHFNSSCTLAGAPIYNKAGVVEVSGGSSSPAVTDAGPYTFRTITTDAFQGEYLINWAVKEEGFKNIAIVYENTDYGQGLLKVAEEEAGELGAKIVVKESYILGQTKDFSPIVTKIKDTKPDVVIIGGLYNETALIAKQMQRSGYKVPIMGVDAIYSDALIELGGDAVDGVMMTGFFHESSSSKEAQDFIAAYKEAYKEEPGTYAAYVFDAANIVIEGLKNGGQDRKKVMEYLTTLKDYNGVTGITSFDENGDCIKQPLKLIVKDGKFEIYNK
ncbi:ABC transporter substrate-binding protein [Petroclostridium sp. X23]|uniref:ABC transporter substrate-binding protein n=1 Tax=Petroclostridium sp. X23 TaxID=3045146 RepID=UPI0024ACD621|nr:ABC transporter substrate-binding protein [Petroclostridium sp. X23]WHH61479.1 ABC transporter substrate-binding protein [Petroclostridium sp. X23]